MTTAKRNSEFCIDSNVIEGLKLIRYTASHIMKRIEATLPEEELKSCESNIMTALANIPKFLTSGSINDFASRPKPRTSSTESFTKECEKTLLKEFITTNFTDITSQIYSLKLQSKKLIWYGFRCRRQDVHIIMAFIDERPTVYRNLTIYIDKAHDQAFFLFREQKACQLKRIEKIFSKQIEIELWHYNKVGDPPKKHEKAFENEILIDKFVHGVTQTKPGFKDCLRKFVYAILKAKIKDIQLPKLGNKFEKELRNIIKMEHHQMEERTYIPNRNDKTNPVHARLGFMKYYSKNATVEDDDDDAQEWEEANNGEPEQADDAEAPNPLDNLATRDPVFDNAEEDKDSKSN